MHSNRLAAFFAALTGVGYGISITLSAAVFRHGATTMAVLMLRCGVTGVVMTIISGIMYIRASGASIGSDIDVNIDSVSGDGKSGSKADPPDERSAPDVDTWGWPIGLTGHTDAPLAVCRRRAAAAWLAGSIASMAAYNLSFLKALSMIPVTECVVILSTYPVVTLGLTAMTEPPGRRPGPTTVGLHILGFAGLGLALMGPSVASDDQSDGGGSGTIGYVLVTVASISFSLHALCSVQLLRLMVPIMASTAAVNVAQTVIFAIVYAVAEAVTPGGEQHRLGLPSWDDAPGTMYLISAVVIFAPATLANFAAFAMATDASHVMFLINMDSVTAILLAIVVLGESFAWYQWIGLFILLGALGTSSFLEKSAAVLAREARERWDLTNIEAPGIAEMCALPTWDKHFFNGNKRDCLDDEGSRLRDAHTSTSNANVTFLEARLRLTLTPERALIAY